MNIIDYFNSPVCVRFALALVHFLWQGLVIALLAVSLASLFGKNSSRTRYGVYVISLFAMVLSLGVTYALIDVSSTQVEYAQPITEITPGRLEPAVTGPETGLHQINETGKASSVKPSSDMQAVEAPEPIVSPKFRLSLDLSYYSPYLISLYLLGVAIMLGRLLLGLQGGQRLRKFSEPVEDTAILALLGQQARALGLTFIPTIALCRRVIVPTVVGVFKPTILLPFSFASGLSPQQVEMLLAHELAHIRRYDPFVNIGQRVIEALLFFHPAVWFISHRIRIERENCCDDIVLQIGGKATEYASSLVDIAQQALLATGSKPCFATEGISATGQPSRLGDRVRRLMGAPKSQQVRLKHTWVVGLMVSILVIAVLAMANTKGDLGSQSEKEIEAIFEKADELSEQMNLRSREYLTSLSDDELAEVYARATAPQQPGGFDRRLDAALEAVKNDRQGIITELVKPGGVFNEEDREDFRRKHQKLVDELAALGSAAVPAIGIRMGDAYRRTGKWALAKEAIVKMGPEAVEPLIPLMDSKDRYIRQNVAYVLDLLADPRAKDVLLRALDDESSYVRKNAIHALIELGPEVVGKQKLVSILISCLQDWACLYESVQGLNQYGDKTAIEALGVIERSHPNMGKTGRFRSQSYGAQQAINAILRRAGKPFKEVTREDYQQKLSHEQMLKAAECSNAAIRKSAALIMTGQQYIPVGIGVDVRKQQDMNEKITNLLGELEKLENKHETVRKNKLDNMSKKEKQQLIAINMAISSGLEKDLDTLVRETANRIAAFGEPAVPILLKELEALPLTHYRHYHRRCIARSLQQIDRPGVPYLIKALKSNTDAQDLRIIIDTLGYIKDSRAVEPLLKSWNKHKGVGANIALALGHIGDKRAVEPIISELEAWLAEAQKTNDWNKQGWLMVNCAQALGRLNDKRAVGILKKALNAGPQKTKGVEQYRVAETAAKALRSLGVEVTGDVE